MIMFQMKRVIPFKLPILWCISPWKIYDKIDDSSITAKEASEATGWDRLRLMFTFGRDETISPELNSAMNAGLTGAFVGAVYGGFIRSRMAYIEFFERNQATAFKSHLDAKKVLQDHVTINFAKGAFFWGWRVGLFTSSLVLISTAVSAYRGKSGILEYSLAGCICGCFFRASLGSRGMIVGGLLGSALGSLGGGVILAILKTTGVTMDDVRNTQYRFYQFRTEAKSKWIEAAKEEKSIESELLKQHDTTLKQRTLSGSD